MVLAACWSAFWPNLASTILGVAFGVPIALKLNRGNVTHAERVRAAAERARIVESLASLRRSLEGNKQRLQTLLQALERDQMPFPLVLDVSTWDALAAQLAGSLKEPDLLSRLLTTMTDLRSFVCSTPKSLRSR